MAAEYRARQKSLNGWRKREGSFNYELANRMATMSLAHVPDLSHSRILHFRQEEVLNRILFVIYLLTILNGRKYKSTGFGRFRFMNNRPLPRANSPPLYFKMIPMTSNKIKYWNIIILAFFIFFLKINVINASSEHPQSFKILTQKIKIINNYNSEVTFQIDNKKLPVFSYEQLFPPAQEQRVDEGRYLLAFAPQDTTRGSGIDAWNRDFNTVVEGDPNSEEWRRALDNFLQYNYFKPGVQHELMGETNWGVDLDSRSVERLRELPPERRKVELEKIVIAQQQTMLKDLGYYTGSVDSIAGPMTRKALQRFERDSHTRNWKARYNLAMKFFEAGKRTGRIEYYNQTVDHLFWIAKEYSILLPTKVRNEMYDFLQELYNGYSVRQNDGVRKAMEERIGVLAWYGRENPVEAKKYLIKVFQAQIYLFPNRGPPRSALRINGEEDEIPIRSLTMPEIIIMNSGSDKDREQLYYKLFPEKAKTNNNYSKPQSFNTMPKQNYTFNHQKRMTFKER